LVFRRGPLDSGLGEPASCEPHRSFRSPARLLPLSFDHERGGFDKAHAADAATLARPVRWAPEPSKEKVMREHSGAEGKNNNRNPTLRDEEKAKGQSGEAIHDSKKKGEPADRKSTIRA
jgi:hypothetical protein